MSALNISSTTNRNFVEEDEPPLSSSYHGDDLMTPPDVLLQLSMKEAETTTTHNDVSRVIICPVHKLIIIFHVRIQIWRLSSGHGLWHWLE